MKLQEKIKQYKLNKMINEKNTFINLDKNIDSKINSNYDESIKEIKNNKNCEFIQITKKEINGDSFKNKRYNPKDKYILNGLNRDELDNYIDKKIQKIDKINLNLSKKSNKIFIKSINNNFSKFDKKLLELEKKSAKFLKNFNKNKGLKVVNSLEGIVKNDYSEPYSQKFKSFLLMNVKDFFYILENRIKKLFKYNLNLFNIFIIGIHIVFYLLIPIIASIYHGFIIGILFFLFNYIMIFSITHIIKED